MYLSSDEHFEEEARVDKGDGGASGEAGELFESEGARGEEGRVRVGVKRIQVQKCSSDPLPERVSSELEANDDGQLRCPPGRHQPAEGNGDNVRQVHKNNRKLQFSQPLATSAAGDSA